MWDTNPGFCLTNKLSGRGPRKLCSLNFPGVRVAAHLSGPYSNPQAGPRQNKERHTWDSQTGETDMQEKPLLWLLRSGNWTELQAQRAATSSRQFCVLPGERRETLRFPETICGEWKGQRPTTDREKEKSGEFFLKKKDWPKPLGRLSERTPTLELLLSRSLGDWTNFLTQSSASLSGPTSISANDPSVELGWAPWVKGKAIQGCPLSDKFFHWMILQAIKHNYVFSVPTTFWSKMLACTPITLKFYMQTLSHTAY